MQRTRPFLLAFTMIAIPVLLAVVFFEGSPDRGEQSAAAADVPPADVDVAGSRASYLLDPLGIEVQDEARRDYDEWLTAEAARVERERLEAIAAEEARAEAARVEAARQAAARPAPVVQYQAPAPSAPVYGDCGSVHWAAREIYVRESGCRTNAYNGSGCRGIGQACPGSKLPCSDSDFWCQHAFFEAYAFSRYGSWEAAWAAWQSKHWW